MAGRRRTASARRLTIWMNGLAVGYLERRGLGALAFFYDASWLGREAPLPISRLFPLREAPYGGPLVNSYFDNLLPDDSQVIQRLAALSRAESTQTFDILAAIGRDCVGALQFYPGGIQPNGVMPATGKAISKAEVATIFQNLRANPLGFYPDREFRISLAGVQSKTALLQMGGKWYLPKGATPTTHILKPAIGALPQGPDLTLSVENEWLCLRILETFGLPVAKAEIMRFENIRTLVVERFDRQWSGKKLFRLPQEDLCQALGVAPECKYQSDGGPGMGEILSVLNESDDRDRDRMTFMKAQIIFWLLAAIDGHAKNFSLFLRPNGFSLTPLYDVMSADPHTDPRNLPKQKLKMAMSVGTKHHYKVQEILPRHWQQTATQHKFSDMDNLLRDVAQKTPQVIAKVEKELPKNFPSTVSTAIFSGLERRTKLILKGL